MALREELQDLKYAYSNLKVQLDAARSGLQAQKDVRRAALNLMEDPLASRAAEQRENAERRRVESELREADRRKDEFLATLAHELRNPLAPIRNSLHILRLAGSDIAVAGRLHDIIERQVNYMVRLVDDLLEVSRITRGKVELRKEEIDLAGVVRAALETSRPPIEAAGHQLAVSLPVEPMIVLADPIRLAQVLSNLLNNAAKYTPEGGQIWLTARAERSNAVLSVRDNGIGIPPEMVSKVFELFTQIDHALGRAQGGLGIGLSLVRSLIDMHGGSVEAHSDGPGCGSEFTVRLPLTVRQFSPREHGNSPAPPSTVARHRVLIVDDNQDAADSLGMLLKHLGANVNIAHSGEEGIRAFNMYRPSVMLLDLGMPEMDGFEVARRIREQPNGREVVLIALTGWGQEEDRRRTQEAGFDHHMVKPAELGALQALLASVPSTVPGRCVGQ